MPQRLSATVSLMLVLVVAVSSFSSSLGDASGSSQTPVVSQESAGSPRAERRDESDRCAGLESLVVEQTELCTHGPDPAPPGFAVDEPVALPRGGVARRALAATTCAGDGQSGYRVQVLYVHAADVASRFDEARLPIQGWVAEMDQFFRDSAAETGGQRRLRFVHDENCQPIVTSVEVSPGGDGSLNALIADLKKRKLIRTDRIYLAFVDTAAAGYCGVGTAWNDDRANGRLNWSNAGPSYSRVDAGCWSADIAAHEVMHNLGGVQHSAPNATGGFHCIDEWDIMCLADGQGPSLREACPDEVRNFTRFDCGNDDYFHTNPPAGSYLATHWNAANSRFLIGSPELPPKAEGKQAKPSKKKRGKKRHNGRGKRGKGGKGKRR